MLRKFLALLVGVMLGCGIVSSPAFSGLAINVNLGPGSTVNTADRQGQGAGGANCSALTGFTCEAFGNAVCEFNAADANTVTVTATGSNDEGNGCIATKTAMTSSDLHIEVLCPATAQWVGPSPKQNFTFCGAVLIDDTGYQTNVAWPYIGTTRFKSDAGGAGELEQPGLAGQFTPRHFGLEYNASGTQQVAAESADAATWSLVGSPVTDTTLTFPVRYGALVSSHDSNSSVTITIDVAVATTLDPFTGDPPTGSDPVWDTSPSGQSWVEDSAIQPINVSSFCSISQGSGPTYTGSGFPTGISISSGGVISGTPTTPSSGNATLTCSDTIATTDAVFSWTVTAAPGGGTNFNISTGTSSINCNSLGVSPGDTITLLGTSRGKLLIQNCVGTANSPIVIRNDTTAAGPLVISGSSGYIFEIRNSRYFTIDGTGAWSGSSGTCSGLLSWPTVGTPGTCGIQIRPSSSTGDLVPRGDTRFFTVKGVETDGGNLGFQFHDHSRIDSGYPYTSFADAEQWQEGVVIYDNYTHDTNNSCMYLGQNYASSSEDEWKLRDWEVSYNRVDDCGMDGIKLKACWGDVDECLVHHNYITDIGLSRASTSVGATDHCIFIWEGNGKAYNNFCGRNTQSVNGRAGINARTANIPSSFGSLSAIIYNNVVVDTAGPCIQVGRDSGAPNMVPTVYNNTVSSCGGSGIQIASSISGGVVRDNIAAGESLSIGGSTANTNNRTGSVASQNFVNAASDNFRLTASSPARNSGTTGAPATDYDDVSRPREGTDDQGAFEYVP